MGVGAASYGGGLGWRRGSLALGLGSGEMCGFSRAVELQGGEGSWIEGFGWRGDGRMKVLCGRALLGTWVGNGESSPALARLGGAAGVWCVCEEVKMRE